MLGKRWTKKRWTRLIIAAAGAAACTCVSTGAAAGSDLPRQSAMVAERETMTAPPADLAFDAASRKVMVKVTADSLSPDVATTVRPSRLQLYEDGVKPQEITVDVEHLPLTVAVLVEMGGRSHELTQLRESEAPYLVAPLLDRLGEDDELAVFTYDRTLRPVIDFGAPPEARRPALDRLEAPRFSEANFYDATIALLERLRIQYVFTYMSPRTGGRDDRVVEVRVSDVDDARARSRASENMKERTGRRVIAQARYRPEEVVAGAS